MSAAESLTLTLPDGSERVVARERLSRGGSRHRAAAREGRRGRRRRRKRHRPAAAAPQQGGPLSIFTIKSPEAGPYLRHTAEHVLADAVKRLWPGTAIDAGRLDHSEKYQYDFRFPRAFTPEDLERIAAKMREIVGEDLPLERVEVSRQEAERLFAGLQEDLKIDRLGDIPEGETITLYRHGPFVDLCRGPHAQRTGQIGALELLESSGVYFRGDESKERLQRIYGTAFAKPAELDEYHRVAELARARDHRKLGPELDLFSFSPYAPGSPFFHPKGAVVYQELQNYVRERNADGYGEVLAPQILDLELWKKSGHWDNYRDGMFFTAIDERQMAVKPMNCPGHCLIYGTRMRSYRDLPIRYAELGRLHRAEMSGVVTVSRECARSVRTTHTSSAPRSRSRSRW